jgi:hypothetical protein
MGKAQESRDEGIYRLTGEQIEEVGRRRANKNALRLTLEEFNERLRRRKASRQGMNCSARRDISPS